MIRPTLPDIPDDLNGIIFRTKDGQIGTLMRPTIICSESKYWILGPEDYGKRGSYLQEVKND